MTRLHLISNSRRREELESTDTAGSAEQYGRIRRDTRTLQYPPNFDFKKGKKHRDTFGIRAGYVWDTAWPKTASAQPRATPGFDRRPLALPPAASPLSSFLNLFLFYSSDLLVLLDVACWLAACLCCRLCWRCCCSGLHCLLVMSCLLIFCTVCV